MDKNINTPKYVEELTPIFNQFLKDFKEESEVLIRKGIEKERISLTLELSLAALITTLYGKNGIYILIKLLSHAANEHVEDIKAINEEMKEERSKELSLAG